MPPKMRGVAAIALTIGLPSALGHVEDICVAPPGDSATSGVYNFFSAALKAGCNYNEATPECVATVLDASSEVFGDSSICRGVVHFNAIYIAAVALGFKQDIAYQMAAFSQATDFVQYQGIDSCGQKMDNKYSTPKMRGLLRTAAQYGGTNYHLGVPFVGWLDESPVENEGDEDGAVLKQTNKTYTGRSGENGCKYATFERDWDQYVKTCPALLPNLKDDFYGGALAHGRRWAMGETDLICCAGFTEIDPSNGSPFTGKRCPKTGAQQTVNVGEIVSGPIPLSGTLNLGEQVINYECDPDCETAPENIIPESIVPAARFREFLARQSKENGYATLDNGEPVPELIARMGVYLHWVADRNSHWYCTDSSGSGVAGVKEKDGKGYNLYMFLDANGGCNFITHSMAHYWEQGLPVLAPGTYSALLLTYREILAFRRKWIKRRPEWFRKGSKPIGQRELVGTYQNPGILFKLAMILEADKRMEAEIAMLRLYNLPPMPGFEAMCGQDEPKPAAASEQEKPAGESEQKPAAANEQLVFITGTNQQILVYNPTAGANGPHY